MLSSTKLSSTETHETPEVVSVARRHRTPAALTVLAVCVALAATACGGAEVASAQKTSEVRPEAPSDVFGNGEEGFDDELPLPDMGDLGELGDDLEEFADGLDEGLGQVGDCATLTIAYTRLLSAFVAEDAATEIATAVGELKDAAPADVQDDLDVVATTLTEAANGGLLDATGAMTSQEFLDANQAVATWLTTECGG